MVPGRLPDASGVGTDGGQRHVRGAASAHDWAACPAGIGPAHARAGAAEGLCV